MAADPSKALDTNNGKDMNTIITPGIRYEFVRPSQIFKFFLALI